MLAERNIPLIEDDIYGEFYLAAKAPAAGQGAFDTCGNVLCVAARSPR